jgi:hypothetical protein
LTDGEDPEKTPFLPILRYVLGFMLILGLLALALVAFLRH